MCGIAGIIALNEKGRKSFGQLPLALKTLSKRGPDKEGVFEDEHIVLGHRRLTILDLSDEASQPMHSIDERFVIVFNGEIFNWAALKQDLAAKGFSFKTESDTEVLLNLYITYGAECINMLNGFFAFCIYDKAEKKGILARDRYGIKPLVYYKDSDSLFFASELKALVALDVPKVLNKEVLPHYFSLGYIPAPATIYKNVYKLKPGNYIEFGVGKDIEVKKYYHLPFPTESNLNKIDYEEAKQELRKLISDAVKIRLMADVPVGAFLSGGVDSSIICAAATEHTSHLHTFSVGFSNDAYIDESKYAKLVAKHLGTQHTIFDLNPDEMLVDIENVLDYLDEPFADSSAVAVYALTKYTSSKVKVSLSGDGGDELFGGYRKHRAEYILRNSAGKKLLGKMANPFLQGFEGSRETASMDFLRKLKKFSSMSTKSQQERYLELASVIFGKDINWLGGIKFNENLRIKMEDGTKGLNDFLWNDLHLVLPNDMLVKVDMMSMANSLEVRIPLLDYRIVDFVNKLPSNFKIDASRSKKILWDAYSDKLPFEVYNRRKMGFEVPMERWLKGPMQPMVADLTSTNKLSHQLFDQTYIQKLLESLNGGKIGNVGFRLWSILVFQFWFYKNNPEV